MGDRDAYAEDLAAELGYREAGLKEVRLRDWYADGPRAERLAFKRLVWRLQARKHWAAKHPRRKARIRAYRRAWYQEHKQHCNEITKAWKRVARQDPEYRERENAKKRATRAQKAAERRAATVYTCGCCGAQWSPATKEIPSTSPRWCSIACRNRVRYDSEKRLDARRSGHKRACPTCGVDAGRRCRSRNGKAIQVPHIARYRGQEASDE